MSSLPPSGGITSFTAAGAALGYVAQVEYALILLLERMHSEDECLLSIEAIDDVTFHRSDGSALEQLQTKHHISRQAVLTDRSIDLWKTINNWIFEAPENRSRRLTLLTTATAAKNSVAALLRDDDCRDPSRAAELLGAIATEGGSKANANYYLTYLSLAELERKDLLSQVYILDSSPLAADTDERLSLLLRGSVRKQRRPALVERLRGWWYKRAILHLDVVARREHSSVSASELEDAIHSISQQLHDENLPVDYDTEPFPYDLDTNADTRIFVEQLRMIAMGSRRIRICIHDHNRAYLQRSRWQREQLLHIGELAAYDARLIDEWRRFFTPSTDEVDDEAEHEICSRARDNHNRLEQSNLPQIREQVRSSYIAPGSLHLLADRLEIGWHPEWLDHLRSRVAEVWDVESESSIA